MNLVEHLKMLKGISHTLTYIIKKSDWEMRHCDDDDDDDDDDEHRASLPHSNASQPPTPADTGTKASTVVYKKYLRVAPRASLEQPICSNHFNQYLLFIIYYLLFIFPFVFYFQFITN